MALDLAKMKEKLSKTKGGGGFSERWHPAKGQNTIRFLPSEDGDPFKEFFVHYTKTSGTFLCPKRTSGGECPLCSHVRSLYDEGTELSKAAAKNVQVKPRYVSAILVRGDDKNEVKLWEYSKQIYEKLLSFVTDPEYGDITDPKSGVDMVVDAQQKAGLKGLVCDVTPKRKSSPLASADDVAKILSAIPSDVGRAFKAKSTSEIQEIMLKMSGAESESDRGGDGGADDFSKKMKSLVGDDNEDDPTPF